MAEIRAKGGADEVPALLERVFYYGQNDFQNRFSYYSTSVGDVVDLGRKQGLWLVEGCGFERFTGDVQELADGNVRS